MELLFFNLSKPGIGVYNNLLGYKNQIYGGWPSKKALHIVRLGFG